LIAAAGKFSLNEEVLAYVRQTKEQEEARVRQQQLRKKDIYDALEAKVKAIREKNLPPDKWSVADINTMLQWYKNPSDTAMPTKKADKLARYYQICMRGDPTGPELLQLPPPLPPSQGLNVSTTNDDHERLLPDTSTSDQEEEDELLRVGV